MNPIDRLLKARQDTAEPEAAEADDNLYHSFRVSRNRAGFGFQINRANGETHGILFHNIDNYAVVQLDEAQRQTLQATQALTITHRGKGVTITGDHLKPIATAITRHLLIEINEPDGRPAKPEMPVIRRMEITDASALPAPRDANASPVRRVK